MYRGYVPLGIPVPSFRYLARTLFITSKRSESGVARKLHIRLPEYVRYRRNVARSNEGWRNARHTKLYTDPINKRNLLLRLLSCRDPFQLVLPVSLKPRTIHTLVQAIKLLAVILYIGHRNFHLFHGIRSQQNLISLPYTTYQPVAVPYKK